MDSQHGRQLGIEETPMHSVGACFNAGDIIWLLQRNNLRWTQLL